MMASGAGSTGGPRGEGEEVRAVKIGAFQSARVASAAPAEPCRLQFREAF